MKSYTIISVSKRPGNKIRSINIWTGMLWIIGVLAIVALIGSWKATQTWFEYTYYKGVYYLEKRKNNNLKNNFENMKRLSQGINSKMNLWFLFEDNIRTMFDMPLVKNEERLLGTGGLANKSANTILKNKNMTELNYLKNNVELLCRQSDLEIYQFDKIKEHIAKQNVLWNHRPSVWPASGRITSEYGMRIHPFDGYPSMHEGVDVANQYGTPIRAPANGVVYFAGYSGRFGNLLILDHGYQYKTYYGHLRTILVRDGQFIKRGDLIGYMGMTGMATGPHLHYEVRVGEKNVNPHQYILPDNFIVD